VGWDNVVGTATCYGLDGAGIKSWWGQDFPHLSRPGVKQLGLGTDVPPPTPRCRMSRAIPLAPSPPTPTYQLGTLWGEKKLITYRNHSVIVSIVTRLQAGQCEFQIPI